MHRREALIDAAVRKTADLQAELERLGWWSDTPPSDEAMADPGPFGMNSLTPAQWLQFVLIARVSEVAHGRGEFPRASNVAAWAARELDGYDETDGLRRLLREFDELFALDLLRVAAGRDPRVELWLADADLVDADWLHTLADRDDPAGAAAQLEDLELVLDAGSEVDWQHPDSGRTALMAAIAFGCDGAERWLLAHGADPTVVDRRGRNAADLRILRLQGRLRRVLPTLRGVRSARLVQLYAPVSGQLSTALVALETDGPFATEPLAELPPTDPAVFTVLGTDAVSRLAQQLPPFWVRAESPR